MRSCNWMILWVLAGASCSNQGSEWRELFDGRTLDNWTVECLPQDQGKSFWTVSEGTILCDSMHSSDHNYVWLVSREEFADFELQLEFQAYRDSPGNSGVQVRSRYDRSPSAPNGGWLDGPQVDIHPPEPWRTGFIYDETREERRWIAPSFPDWNFDPAFAPARWTFYYADEEPGWNQLRINCSGTRIQTFLNGNSVADLDGAGLLDSEAHRLRRVGTSGHLALQLHSSDRLRIRFRDLRIREF